MDQVDYDKLLGNATERRDDMAAGPDTSMYDEILQKDDQQQNEQLMNSLFAVGGINPDQAAEAQKLGLELGVGPDIARRNMEELRRRSALMKAQEYKLTATSPILARQLTDPEFAAIAQDDLAHLTATEKTVQVMKNVGGSVASGFLNADAGIAGALRFGAELYGGAADQISGALGFDASGDNAAQSAAKWLEGFQNRRTKLALSYTEGRESAGLLERGFYSGIESATQMIATLPTLLGGPEAYLAANVATVGGQEYGKARDKGLSPLPAGIYAMGQGAVEYATEKIPVLRLIEDLGGGSGLIKTIGRQMAEEIPGEQVATVLQDMNEWAVLNPDKPFSSYLAERPSAAAETLIATIVATGAQTTLIKGAEAAFSKIDRAGADAWRANLMAENLKRLTESAANSKLRQRSPDAYQKYVAAQTIGTPVENMYVDAAQLVEVLKQSNVSNGELDAMLPGLREQLAGAVLPGGNVVGDVKIPTAQYAARVAGTDLGNALMPHLRMGEDAVSEAEAGQFETLRQQMVDEAGKILEEKRATDEAFVKSAAEVESTLLEQLKSTGIYTPEQSRAAATLQAATYTSLANQMGMTPSEVYALLPYKQQVGAGAGQGGMGSVPVPPAASGATPKATAPSTFADMVKPFPGEGYRLGPISFEFNQRGGNRYIRVRDRSGKNLLQAADGAEPSVDVTDVWSAEDPNQVEPRQGNKVGINSLENNVPTQFEPIFRDWLEGKIDENEAVARIKATERSTPNDPNILNQTAAPLQGNPLSIIGTGPNGRILNQDLGRAFTERHMADYGRALDPSDPADYEIVLRSLQEDYAEQTQQPDNGEAWYSDDIAEAIRVTTQIIPELDDPQNRDLFLTIAALLSPQQKPVLNWENAILAMQGYLQDGKIPVVKPNGKNFGVASHTTGLQLLQHLITTKGLTEALLWVRSPVSGREMAEVRRDSGLFEPKDKLAGYLPSETNLNEEKLGIYMMGPKVGDFMQNSVGIDHNAVTVDLWMARTYNRLIGRLMDVAPGVAEAGGLADQVRGRAEREMIKRLVREAAAEAGIDPSAMQAALWYFEQRLYRNHGIRSDSQNFSGAARTAAGKRGIIERGSDVGGSQGGEQATTGDASQGVQSPDTLNQGPRGGYIPQRFTTLLNEKADVSTVFHEFSHFYLDALTRLVANPAASEQMKSDLKQLVEFGGATMEEWTAWTAEYDATGTIPEGMRRVHEAVAYNSEIYLFEGKAPAPELQGVFDRVVRWMKQVYTTIRDQLNAAYRAEFGADLPMLTPEVRGVFDRMLASEDQIKQAEAIRNMGPIFTSQAESGMSPEEWAAYQVMLEEARDAAVTDLTKASLRQMQWLSNARGRILKQMQRAHEARRKEIRAKVEDEIKQRPVYRAMQFLKRGTIDGSEVEYPVKLSIPEIEAMYGDNPIVGLIKKGLGVGKYGMLASENAMHPDQVAEMFGFKSGDDLVRQLLAAPPMREAVAAETDARMLAENGDMNTPQALDAAVEAALHNEARARFVAVELRFLQKATEPVRLMLKAAQQIARGMISKKVVKDIRPKEFAAAEARAARKAMDLIKDGKSREAAQAKQAQLLQNQLAAEAIAAREEIAQAMQMFRKVFKADKAIAKGRNLDLVNAARAILAAHGIGKADKAPVEYTKQLQAYNPELYAELEPLIIRASAGARAYDTLTMDEFRGMRDAVAALWFQARRDHQIEVDGKKMELDAVEAELNDRLVAIGIPQRVDGEKEAAGAKERMVRHLFQGKALIRRVEHWADATDGPGGPGPFTRYIWRPMRKAIDAYRAQRNIYVKRYIDLLSAVDLPVAKIAAPELGYTFGNANGGIGKAEVLGAMLHTGNESNLRKLLLGRGWGKELEDGTLDTSRWDAFRLRMINEGVLTKADFDFLQAVWDLTEELKPQAQKAHHDLFGYYFKEVEAKGFTTPFGAYRGGYVPAKVDPHMVRDAQVHQKMEDMESDFRNSMPSTGMGFTKGRVEYNKPLSLDVRLIARHIDDVIRFSHVQPVVKDVLRILRRRGFADNLTRIDPTAIEGMLLPWLNRSARQITSEAGKHKAVDRFWSAVRSRAGIGIMFANITNALQQVTGYFPALLKVKPTYLKSALVQYMSGLQGMTDEVARLSPFMADRMQNQMFDLQDTMNDLLLNPSRYDKVQKWAAHHGYFLQQAFQNQVDVVTWTATLNQTLAELGADRTDAEAMKEAVARADAAVRLTQSSLAPEDISAFEVGSPFYKTLIQFSGYFNMMANLNASEYTKIFRDLGWRGNKGKLFMAYLLGFGLPMLISDAIVRSLGGGWDDEDDDGYLDVFMSWFFGSQVRGAVALVPGAGPSINALFNAFDDKPYNDRLSISPAITVLEGATFGTKAFVSNVIDPEKDVTGKNVRDVLTLVSLVTGIPVTVLGRPVGYQVEVSRGKVEPTSAVDYARGLITGKASPDSRQ